MYESGIGPYEVFLLHIVQAHYFYKSLAQLINFDRSNEPFPTNIQAHLFFTVSPAQLSKHDRSDDSSVE